MDHAGRMQDFRVRMEREGLDAYWLPDRANVRYLCGFTGEDSALLVTAYRSVLLTDSRYAEQAEDEAHVDEVVSRTASMAGTVCALCKKLDVRNLGVTGANLSHATYLALAGKDDALDVRSLAPGIAEDMRLCKDAEEVEAVRAALKLSQRTFRRMLRRLKPGRSEKWLAARFEYEMRTAGADGPSFESICAVDANASVPHASPGEDKVTAGSSILFDWGVRCEGYCSDLTRLVSMGRIGSKLRKLIDVVLAAQAAVIQTLEPGVRCCDADAAGRSVIAKSGYGNNFGHGIGHGVGLVVHEGPRLAPGVDTVLLPGMIVTVEPGVYLPGECGVRIEDMVLITSDGHEVLSSLPQRPEELEVG